MGDEWHVGVYTSDILAGGAALWLADNTDVVTNLFPIAELDALFPFQGIIDDHLAGLTADG
jgi:hypothetical protein